MMKKLILKEGTNHVSLFPLTDTLAHVLSGNVHQTNDLVVVRGADWSEASEELPGGDTFLSPFDLDLIYDSITGHCHFAGLAVTDAAAIETDPLLRTIVQVLLLHGAPLRRPKDNRKRRRRSDHAA